MQNRGEVTPNRWNSRASDCKRLPIGLVVCRPTISCACSRTVVEDRLVAGKRATSGGNELVVIGHR